jgi:hypothetical protein
VLLSVPPADHEYQGRELCPRFLKAVAFRNGQSYGLVATRANGQPAFGIYLRDPHAPIYDSNGLLVLTLPASRSAALPASIAVCCATSDCREHCPTEPGRKSAWTHEAGPLASQLVAG